MNYLYKNKNLKWKTYYKIILPLIYQINPKWTKWVLSKPQKMPFRYSIYRIFRIGQFKITRVPLFLILIIKKTKIWYKAAKINSILFKKM